MLPGREKREERREKRESRRGLLSFFPSLVIGVSAYLSNNANLTDHILALNHPITLSLVIFGVFALSSSDPLLSHHLPIIYSPGTPAANGATLPGFWERCPRNSSKHCTFLVTIQAYNNTGTGSGRVGNQQTNPVSSSNNHPTS